jgi:hypothetical protein
VALYFLDTTLIDAHSEKQHAARMFKRGFGLHPMWAFIDHGQTGLPGIDSNKWTRGVPD